MNESEQEHLKYYQQAIIPIKTNTIENHANAREKHDNFCKEIYDSLIKFESTISDTITMPSGEFLNELLQAMSINVNQQNKPVWEKAIAVAHARFISHQKRLSGQSKFSEAWSKLLSLSDGTILTVGHFSHSLLTVESNITQLKADVKGLRADVTELRADVKGLRADVTELRADVTELRADVKRLIEMLRNGPGPVFPVAIAPAPTSLAATTHIPALSQRASPSALRSSSRVSGSKRTRPFQDSKVDDED